MKLAELRAPSLPGARPDQPDPRLELLRRVALLAVAAAVVATVALGLVLRFWTHSNMWLDEALTLNISRLPVHQIPEALRHDGAPPLYYVMLHYWVGWFGTSNLAVRSLSGVFGVLSLPLAWLAGRRLGGRSVAWVTLVVVASSPFAVRYATENRMYSIVIFLVLAGYLLLDSALERTSAATLIGLALVTGLLLYSHYWSIYLLVVVAAYVLWVAVYRRSMQARWVLGALFVGALTFVPWLPIFVYQNAHTGTPWAMPASFSAMVHAVSEFAGGDASPARALVLVFFALLALAIFGKGVDRRHIDLDLSTRPPARALTVVTAGTLALAIAVGYVSGNAFQARYTAVVFPTFVLLVALGTTTILSRYVRYAVVTATVVLGLAVSFSNVTTDRTQAGQVATVVRAQAAPGDVVGYCPDQLGPAVSRLVGSDLVQVTFPRRTGPRIVNWVDYAATVKAADPASFARALVDAAGPNHAVWYVWAPGYLTLNGKCEAIGAALGALRPSSTELVHYDSTTYYEFDDLVRYLPR